MRYFSTLLLSAIIFCTAFINSASATYEKPKRTIKEAFGKTLGDTYRSNQGPKEQIIQWKFTPSKKSPYFQNYYFWTSPLSKKIIGIAAVSQSTDLASCVQQAKELMVILKTKYPKTNKEPATNPFHILYESPQYAGKYFVHHFKLATLKKFIEVSCVSDIPVTSKGRLDASDTCYKNNYGNRYVSANGVVFSKHPVFSRHYVHSSQKNDMDEQLFHDSNIWGYEYSGTKYYPIPNRSFRSWKIPSCADVRLAVRYGNTRLESIAEKEYQEIKTHNILKDERAQGL